MAWYRPEQWSLLRALAADPEVLEDTYDQWLAGATKGMREMAARGLSAIKVDIDVRELSAWCQEHQRPLDGDARVEFVTTRMREDENST